MVLHYTDIILCVSYLLLYFARTSILSKAFVCVQSGFTSKCHCQRTVASDVNDTMSTMFLAYMPPKSIYDGTRLNNIQGKVAELRLELNSGGKKDKNYTGKKIALKKIVANMTMSNNDMVALFPDIIGCMGIQSLEIKKM